MALTRAPENGGENQDISMETTFTLRLAILTWPYWHAEPSPESFQQGGFAFLRGGFAFVRGGLDIQKLTKTALIHTASCFNLGGLGALFGGAKPTKATPWRRDCWHVLSPVFLFVISSFCLLFGWMLFLAESLSSLWNFFLGKNSL